MSKLRIRIIDDRPERRTRLRQSLIELGHDVFAPDDYEAIENSLENIDVLICDLTTVSNDSSTSTNGSVNIVKSYKLDASNCIRLSGKADALRQVIGKALECKRHLARDRKQLPYVHETINFNLPSDLSIMHDVVEYMVERVALLGIIDLDRSNLFTALDEAFVNAVKHGNKNDPTKLLKIDSDLSTEEARITIEDEGEGFSVENVPDPRDLANLFKESGRGVLLICNIMDEVKYNTRGNKLTMIKRRDNAPGINPVDSTARAEDCPTQN
jgi:serine/threonine-protein kinase RsbW